MPMQNKRKLQDAGIIGVLIFQWLTAQSLRVLSMVSAHQTILYMVARENACATMDLNVVMAA